MSFTDLRTIDGLLRDEFVLTETCSRKHKSTVVYSCDVYFLYTFPYSAARPASCSKVMNWCV